MGKEVCMMGTESGVNRRNITLDSPAVSSARILEERLSGRYQKTCKCMQSQLMHPAGNKPSLKVGVGGPARCLGLRGRKHPSVSPGSKSRQHNCVGNCKLHGDF